MHTREPHTRRQRTPSPALSAPASPPLALPAVNSGDVADIAAAALQQIIVFTRGLQNCANTEHCMQLKARHTQFLPPPVPSTSLISPHILLPPPSTTTYCPPMLCEPHQAALFTADIPAAQSISLLVPTPTPASVGLPEWPATAPPVWRRRESISVAAQPREEPPQMGTLDTRSRWTRPGGGPPGMGQL